ncbi:MAG: LuxR C-terminal-related transcriptional regulator [Sedimentibacter sp.]|uniref:helix-turn-helix transcriptional regulator n=1 Tax=Sedimentibacter sp. TaxID=1960295 RepID=UPI003158C14F
MFDKLKKILSSGGKESYTKIIEDEASDMEEDSKLKDVSQLTPREYELYLLLLEGFSLKECAEKLSVKYSTANTHMTAVYKKLKVNTRAELIIKYRNIKNQGEIT